MYVDVDQPGQHQSVAASIIWAQSVGMAGGSPYGNYHARRHTAAKPAATDILRFVIAPP